MKEVKKCRNCGKTFIASQSRQIYCSHKCCAEVSKEADKRRMQEKNKKKKEQRNRNPHQDLIEISVAARRAGMTYGQYVAWKGL